MSYSSRISAMSSSPLRSASIDAYCDIVGALIIAYWCSFVIGAISSFGPTA